MSKSVSKVIKISTLGLVDLDAKQKMPQLPKQKVMPMPDDEASKQARRRSIAAQTARKGRASTMLTQSSGTGEKLG